MSKELASRIDRDLSASESTKREVHEARKRGRRSGVNWELVLALYRAESNKDPEKLLHLSGDQPHIVDFDLDPYGVGLYPVLNDLGAHGYLSP